MNNWQTVICNTNGISIHFTRTGGEKPPIVLLHGLMTNGLCWTGLARALEKEFDELIADAKDRHPGRSDENHVLFAQARLQTSMAAFDILTPRTQTTEHW
jgi:pimeloyl-ACP methyl ester carboxylesterase